MFRPIISPAAYPYMSVAPAFQLVMTPSSVLPMIASADDSTMAAGQQRHKFRGREPSLVEVSATRGDGEWQFTVSDNGIGIEPQYADRVFAVFQRLHSRDEYPGTGIGLAICKKIVETHGGTIWLDSQPGQGSRFCWTIPAAREQP